MAYLTNRTHFLPFLVLNGGTPVIGLTLSSFVVTFFKDLTVCTLPVTITEKGSGFYIASYTPTQPGFYYLNLHNAANSFYVSDGIEIDSPDTQFGNGNTIALTQDYQSAGALRPTILNSSSYVLNIYRSKNWDLGNKGPAYVVATTALDSSGNWITSPLTILPDVYHLVLENTLGTVIVFRPYLDLT